MNMMLLFQVEDGCESLALAYRSNICHTATEKFGVLEGFCHRMCAEIK